MACSVHVRTADGKVRCIALCRNGEGDKTVTMDTLRSVAVGAVNLYTMKAGNDDVAGSIKAGEVQAPPDGWREDTIYRVMYGEQEDAEENAKEEKEETGAKMKTKVEEILSMKPDMID